MSADTSSRMLSQSIRGRDNNFNLLRFIAAFAVLVDHSFVLVSGTADAEPFRKTLGIALGNIAVDAFFITSGFLVTSSLFARRSALALAVSMSKCNKVEFIGPEGFEVKGACRKKEFSGAAPV